MTFKYQFLFVLWWLCY